MPVVKLRGKPKKKVIRFKSSKHPGKIFEATFFKENIIKKRIRGRTLAKRKSTKKA